MFHDDLDATQFSAQERERWVRLVTDTRREDLLPHDPAGPEREHTTYDHHPLAVDAWPLIENAPGPMVQGWAQSNQPWSILAYSAKAFTKREDEQR